MTTVKAAVCHAHGADLVIEEVSLGAPGPEDVEVALGAVAICHSDLTYMDGGWGGALPAVFGHEAAGTVTTAGTASGYAPGERVLVTLLRACGACAPCGSGHPAICEAGPGDSPISGAAGTPVAQGMACGAFAERVVVHRSQLARLPEKIGLDVACLLACGVITGIGAVVNSARLRVGEDVVVIGAGGVGLNVIQGAHIAGARRIVAIDMMPDKLETAREFGATDGVLATDPAPWDAVRRAIGRGADAVFVAVGAIPAYEAAPRYLATGGRVVMVGLPHSGAEASYLPVDLASSAQGMTGSKMGDVVLARDIPWMVDLYAQGRLELDRLISGRWRLDDINAAIADTRTGHARRNVIVFD